MDFNNINKELLAFLDASPNAFFAVKNMAEAFEKSGLTRLYEGKTWELKAGEGYYVTRNDSAIIAFKIPDKDWVGFQIMASHCDSPGFKLKPNAEMTVNNTYLKLNIEKYGGMLNAPWLDRPLSVAGRVVVKTKDGIETKLLKIERDLLIIPNLAIHMNRQANDGYVYNAQTDMLPLYGQWEETEEKIDNPFMEMLANELGISIEDILDTDLYLYDRMPGKILGLKGEFISSGRLDDLQCAFASMEGFIESEPGNSVSVHCVFDNEEVGSETKQGAGASFLRDTLERINMCLGRSHDDYLKSLASSFMISADNAHAVHPNLVEKTDPTNRPYLNKGIVIKYNANQKYTTDAISAAIVKQMCDMAKVPFQTFTNRSDMPGGSTLGNISQGQVSLKRVDIGLPQLAMHSVYETAGSKDTAYLVELAKTLYSTSVYAVGDGKIKIEK